MRNVSPWSNWSYAIVKAFRKRFVVSASWLSEVASKKRCDDVNITKNLVKPNGVLDCVPSGDPVATTQRD